jgi:signal transduction histidine kinase
MADELHRGWRFGWSRPVVVTSSFALTILLGYLDYLTGSERSLLLFYLLPVALVVWFGNRTWGLVFSGLAVAAWVASDLAAGSARAGLWNLAMALAAFVIFAVLLGKLRSVLTDLDERVQQRTQALQHEVLERQRLDREIAEVAERERRRLGQDLHDTLCQDLTGIALTAQTLREKLAARSAPEVAEADKIIHHLEEGIDLTRNLARGFFSPELEAEGLSVALESLAENTIERFGIACSVDTSEYVGVNDSSVATQLYRIAQEAVMNAIKHAGAQHIDIRLANRDGNLSLTVADDGKGLPDKLPASNGLGLRLMSHGAALLGAHLDVQRNPDRGTSVFCKLKMPEGSN